jgi:hypothetical protein
MGFFLQPDQHGDRIDDHSMLKAALKFYTDTFKGRSFVSNKEMTAALAARIAETNSEFQSKPAEEWAPYFDAARKLLGIEPC